VSYVEEQTARFVFLDGVHTHAGCWVSRVPAVGTVVRLTAWPAGIPMLVDADWLVCSVLLLLQRQQCGLSQAIMRSLVDEMIATSLLMRTGPDRPRVPRTRVIMDRSTGWADGRALSRCCCCYHRLLDESLCCRPNYGWHGAKWGGANYAN